MDIYNITKLPSHKMLFFPQSLTLYPDTLMKPILSVMERWWFWCGVAGGEQTGVAEAVPGLGASAMQILWAQWECSHLPWSLGTKGVFLSCLLLWKLFCSCKLPLKYTQVLQLIRNFLCFTKIRLCLPLSQHPKWLAVPVNPSLWILWRPLTARGDCFLPECFLSRRKSMEEGALYLTSINYTVPLHLRH